MYRKQYQSVTKHVCIHSSMTTCVCHVQNIRLTFTSVQNTRARNNIVVSCNKIYGFVTSLSRCHVCRCYIQHTLVPLICSLFKMLRRKNVCLVHSNSYRHRNGTINIKKENGLFIPYTHFPYFQY